MSLLNDRTSSQDMAEQHPGVPADRTYTQLVQNLAERNGTYMTPARLQRMCRVAEMNLDRVLQAYSTVHN